MTQRNIGGHIRGLWRKPLWINGKRSLGRGAPPTPTLDLPARVPGPPGGKIAAVLVRCKLTSALPPQIAWGGGNSFALKNLGG